jgi:hypothetical protein
MFIIRRGNENVVTKVIEDSTATYTVSTVSKEIQSYDEILQKNV